VLLIIGLLSGVLAVFREVQMMYFPPKLTDKKIFWGYVRIAFVISMVLLLWDEHTKIASPRYIASDPIQKEKRAGIRRRLGDLLTLGRTYRDTVAQQNPRVDIDQEIQDWYSQTLQYISQNLDDAAVTQFMASPDGPTVAPSKVPEKRKDIWVEMDHKDRALDKLIDQLK
jgi:hypothetical protein